MNLHIAALFLPGLLIGLTLHEFAHAWSASLLGDDFARRQGRVSLNPLRHLTPLGTLAILFLPIGWGRPVPVNLYNFRRPWRDYLLTSLAGPIANLVVATAAWGLCLAARHTYVAGGGQAHDYMEQLYLILRMVVLINALMAAFNLLPIPPLDGSKIWPAIFPPMRRAMNGRLTYVFLLAVLLFVWTGGSQRVLDPVINGVLQVLPESDGRRFEQLSRQASNANATRQYARAVRLSGEAIAIWPGDANLWLTRGIALDRQGDVAAARTALDRAMTLAGDDEGLTDMIRVVLDSTSDAPATAPADEAPPIDAAAPGAP